VFEGAVSGTWGVADARDFARGDREAAYRVVRIPFPDDVSRVLEYASGVEVAREAFWKTSAERTVPH
jgi:hypothetical protein